MYPGAKAEQSKFVFDQVEAISFDIDDKVIGVKSTLLAEWRWSDGIDEFRETGCAFRRWSICATRSSGGYHGFTAN